MGGLSKRGAGYLLRVLVHGARAVIRWQHSLSARPHHCWLIALLGRRHVNVAAAALATRMRALPGRCCALERSISLYGVAAAVILTQASDWEGLIRLE